MRKAITPILLLTLALLISFVLNPAIPAAAQSSTYTGINVLFIVDQSGSMGGIRYDGLPTYGDGNDVFDLRFAGPQYALRWLNDLRGASLDVNKPDINFALLAFGTDPRIVQGWESLNTDDPDWRGVDLPQLEESISADRWVDRNLNLTDFLDAFDEAESSFFRSLPTRPGKKYLNVIITLTDGAPCADGETVLRDGESIYICDAIVDDNRPLMVSHLQRLNTFVENSFGGDDYEMYVIGLDVPDQTEFWDELQPLWREVVCKDPSDPLACDPNVRHKRVTASEEIGIQVQAILNDVVSYAGLELPPTVYNGGIPASFNIEPYQQSVRVDIFKTNSDQLGTLTINSPVGATLPDDDTGDGTPIRLLRFDNPATGGWTVAAPNPAQVKNVVVQTYPAGIKLEPVAGGEILSGIPLVTQLVRGDGSPLPNVAGSPELNVEALIYDATLPDLHLRPLISTLILPRDPAFPDEYRFSGTWIPQIPGTHEIRVRATYIDPTGATKTLIDDQTMQDDIEIKGATIDWQGITPLSERLGRPFTVRASVINNETGDPLAALGTLSFRAIIENADGTPYNEIILPNEGGAPGEMTARFILEQAGDYRVRMEVGILGDASFAAIGNPSDAIPLTVRPVRPLSLAIMQPGINSMEAQAVSFSPPALTLFTPVTVQVGIRDDTTGTWVALADVTGGVESKPVLLMNPGESQTDLSPDLVEVQPGIYTTTLDGLWPGSYTFNASVSTPGDLLIGDYVWQATTVTRTLTRVWSFGFIGTLLLLALIVIGSVVVIAYIIVRDRRLREHPLTGSISFMLRPADAKVYGETPLGTLDLERVTRNRQEFGKKDLPSPFERLVLSRKATDNEGYATIELLRFDGRDTDKAGRLLRPGSEIVVGVSEDGESEFVITKDAGFMATEDFLAAAKKN
jgi:hypothetical protein